MLETFLRGPTVLNDDDVMELLIEKRKKALEEDGS
jgi:hypothetical protein